MKNIKLIITCEECGHVEHMDLDTEQQVEAVVAAYRCPGSCRSTKHSYISIGEITFPIAREAIYAAA